MVQSGTKWFIVDEQVGSGQRKVESKHGAFGKPELDGFRSLDLFMVH